MFRQTRFFLSFIACFFVLACGCKLTFAYGDPHEVYFELESEHFVLHYPASRQAFARRAIAIAEEAHAVLAPVFGTVTKEKTHIAIENHLDTANGWARVVNINEIHLYPYPPYAMEELGHYSDWMRQLIYHEYTHILHMDTSDNPLYTGLNVVFGKFARGNATMPRWFTEGLAVYFETKTSSGGRLRYELYHTMMRNAALDGRIPSLGGMSAQPVAWPAASANYIFGAFFIQWIAEKYGEQKLIEYIHAYSRQVIPYAMNRVALRVFGDTFDALYDEWRAFEIRKARKERIAFEKNRRATPAKQILAPHRHAHPNARPKHNAFSFYQNDGAHRTGIALYDGESKDASFLTECWSTCDSKWDNAGERLFYDHLESKDGYIQINSLFVYNMAQKCSQRLTRDIHVRSFDVSETSLYLIAQQHEAVVILRVPLSKIHADMVQDEFETLYRGRDFEQLEELHVLSGESWQTDRLAMTQFSLEKRGVNYQDGALVSEPHRDLAHHVVTVYAGKIDNDGKWLENGLPFTTNPTRDPAWIVSEEGVSLAYSAVAEDGTLTRYLEDENGNTKCFARRLEGIHEPTMLENGNLVYVQYTSKGKAIAVIDKDALFSAELSESPCLSIWKRRVMDKPLVMPEVAERDYLPWRWLFPLAWWPSFAMTGEQFEIGLAFSGRDYLDHHNYMVSASYHSGLDVFNFSASYLYARLLWNISLSAGIWNSSAFWFDGKRNQEYDYQQATGSLMTSRTWHVGLAVSQLTLGINMLHTQSSERFSYSLSDPAGDPPRFPEFGWHNALYVNYVLSNLRQYEKAVAVSDGQRIRASLRFEAPWLGAEHYAIIASLDAQFSWTLPWFETHVIGMTLSAGTSYVQNEARMPFAISTSVNTTFSLDDLLSLSNTDALVHGYQPGTLNGQHYLYAHLNYHFGIYDPVLGVSTLPIGLQRISATIYCDWGYAWNTGEFNILRSKPAIGATLHFDITLGYRLIQRFSIGYAYGDMHQFYFGFF